MPHYLRLRLVVWVRWFALAVPCLLFSVAHGAQAASLQVVPASGTFTVDNTFDVSLMLDTAGQAVNAIGVDLSFPPDKLQLVSPDVVGQSIVQVWSAQPKFNNQTGTIELQGGVPGGITTSQGLISTLRFRVKSIGTAVIKILDTSRVLLNDGRGTDALQNRASGIYELALPPPAGPLVVSDSHPDQSKWYPSPNLSLSWAADPDVEGYSYILSDQPGDVVDDISEGTRHSVTYRNVSDGVHYFHIKALRQGSWGGVTHFAARVDTTPPAQFPVEVVPSARTSRQQPLINFTTTDALSGISHYELKLVPLQLTEVPTENQTVGGSEQLFIEAQSPYVPTALAYGTYNVIVRAYDVAGNVREVTQHLAIVHGLLQFAGDNGLELGNSVVVAWPWVWIILGVLIGICGVIAWRVRAWHRRVEARRLARQLPNEVQQQLNELQAYRQKYGGVAALLLAACLSWLVGVHVVHADEIVQLAPPLVTIVSHDISNQEIFYIGGKTSAPATGVTIYLQNLQNGETIGEHVTSDAHGDWFYRHGAFLSSGSYLLWVQGKLGELQSPPSAQVQLTVEPTAVQFGASRLSYQMIYLFTTLLLIALLVGIVAYLVFHMYHGRRKHVAFLKEVREAEESVRRGFAVLRRDIEAELGVIHRAKLSKELSLEERTKEEQLMKDLAWVEKYIGKEVWDVERADSGA